jgi:phosphate transport system permease protein
MAGLCSAILHHYLFTLFTSMVKNSEPADRNQPNQPQVVGNTDITVVDPVNLFFEQGFIWLVRFFSLLTGLTLVWMTWVIFHQALPAISKFGLGFIFSQEWDAPNDIYGALPYIYGTLVSSAIAMIFAVPVGLAVALVTSESFIPKSLRSPLAFVVQLISAIPSVIVGLWAIAVLIPLLVPIQTWLSTTFSWIPLFNTPSPTGYNLFTAGIVLGIMVLPTMASISRDVLLVIPRQLRSGSMALGATQWETIFKVVLPTGISGIISASMIALGRAIGETMAVTLVIGNVAQITPSLLDTAYSIPSVLANEFPEAATELHVGALTYLGLILFALTLIINIGATLVVKSLGAKYK